MPKQPKISETEWRILEALWDESPLSASEVHEKVKHNDKTVRVLLDRMLEKEVVTRRKVHGVWVYEPAIERDDCLFHESRSFLERFFGSDPIPLFANLVKNNMITKEDLAELQKMLKDKERGKTEGQA